MTLNDLICNPALEEYNHWRGKLLKVRSVFVLIRLYCSIMVRDIFIFQHKMDVL